MKRHVLIAAGVSLPLALCIIMGIQLERTDRITLGPVAFGCFLLLSAVLTALIGWTFTLRFPAALASTPESSLSERMDSTSAENPRTRNRVSARMLFLRTWGILTACNLVVLLGVYPGFFVYDAQDELNEVVTRTFDTHHPLLHVLTMGGTVTGVHKFTGSWNLGIFLYLLLQMLFITGIYAFILERLRQLGLKKSLRILFTLWYALFPTIVMYTLCSSKDGLFSAFTTLFVFTLAELRITQDRSHDSGGQTSRLLWLRLMVCAVFMMLLRNNACYVLAVFGLLLLPGLFSRMFRSGKADVGQHRMLHGKLVALVIISIVIYLFSNRLLIAATHARHDEHQEMLTTLIQALGRSYNYHPEAFTETDREILLSYLTPEGLSDYEDRDSDLLKITFNNARYESDPLSFLKLWARIGRRCPGTYLTSWLLTSYGLWHPFTVQNVYRGHTVFTFTYTESSYFGYETELPGLRQSLIPPIDAFYRWLSLDDDIQRFPVLSLLFAPAFWFWFYVWFAARKCAQKKAGCLLPLIPLFLLWLTYLIGPYALVRYALPFFTSLPVLTILHADTDSK